MADSSMVGNGLYLNCCFIQLMSRERRDEDGRKKRKYYVMVALPGGAYNVSLTADEFDRLSDLEDNGKLERGADLLIAVEAFAFRDKVYFRAEDDVRILGAAPRRKSRRAAVADEDGDGDDADAVSAMEASIKASMASKGGAL